MATSLKVHAVLALVSRAAIGHTLQLFSSASSFSAPRSDLESSFESVSVYQIARRTLLCVRKKRLDIIHQVPHPRRDTARREHKDALLITANTFFPLSFIGHAPLARTRLTLQRRIVHGRQGPLRWHCVTPRKKSCRLHVTHGPCRHQLRLTTIRSSTPERHRGLVHADRM